MVMDMLDTLILNMMLISYPLLIYIIYSVGNKNVSKGEKNGFLDFSLLSSAFLLLNYENYTDNPILTFFLGGLVFLAIYRERKGITIILEGTILLASMAHVYLTVYYILFFLFFHTTYFLTKKSHKWQVGLNILYLFFYSLSFSFMQITDSAIYSFFLVLLFTVFTKYLTIALQKGEEIMKTHLEFKDLQKERQIQLSLFKITHEIKNPVAVCKAYLDMFDTENVEHAQKYVPILKSEIERLLLLLQDFLLVNKTNMRYEIMDMNMLLEEVSKNFEPVMREHHIHFKVDILDDELFINGDYNRLNQVMINVLKNSIEAKAMDIVLRTHLTSKVLEIYVEDNGEGISKETFNRMYEPFYTTKSQGTGLGVSLSNEIIEAHNGKLEYKSKEGIGTVVKITLPIYVL